MFLSLDGTFVVQIIDFVVFLVLMNLVFFKPVNAVLRKRRAYINSVVSEYDTAVQDARGLRGQAEAKRAQARREADEAAGHERSAAQAEAGQIAADYTQRVETIVDGAHATVAEEVAQAKSREDELVRGLADMMLERTLGSAKR
jgi:F-type H+-transporting ATPase subunit b